MFRSVFKALLLIVALVAAVYYGVAWYHSTSLGPGQASDDWEENDFLDLGKLEGLDSVLMNRQGIDPNNYTALMHADQGSLVLPRDIFLALKTVDGGQAFTDPANMLRYRYLPGRQTEANPDGLPIGFSRSQKLWQGEEFVGLTCSACHSGMLTYKGTGLYIIGAPTQADFQTMTEELGAALAATLQDPARLSEMAAALNTDPAKLRPRLEREDALLQARLQINASPLRYGYGRVDAVGQIYNQATSVNLGLPQNATPPVAPVSYPHIWGTGQADVAQWTGFAPNDIIGSILLRNVGEVIGVFGRVDVDPGKEAFPSSVNIEELGDLEDWVNRMEPPAWPEDIFGAIDRDVAAEGEALYNRHCKGCHKRADPYEDYKATLVSPDELGVDPLAARATLATAQTLDGSKKPKLKMLIEQTFQVVLDHPGEMVEAIIEGAVLDKFGKRGGFTYKARTLNGIWATPPYLHNGSVPTLYDLLSPPEERPKTFTLGGWEFDPERVGLAPHDGADGFIFDTSLPGNRNTGHDSRIFGTTFTPDQRLALIEYLKTF
ncbi:di-heme-cytochrome C peroxidase [Marimonas sp. MJW-29]|uniref:Di-heme-cytochrome C peroxidase n=1 Tax=Sulfitobacter sediminis TaxID=3234186 RepID=A0ABV3RNV1_9RHOB